MAESLVTLEEADIDDLPPFARELVVLIGFGATIRLIELRPGVPLYIPCEVHPDHSLALALGMNAAQALVKNYGGITITPPNCKVAMVKIRHRNILKTRAEGYSQTEAALLFGLTPRQIRNIESNLPEEDLNGSLF
ncbi:MAG: hypothetical protein AB1400_05750 [Pseudomonadota bacterium]